MPSTPIDIGSVTIRSGTEPARAAMWRAENPQQGFATRIARQEIGSRLSENDGGLQRAVGSRLVEDSAAVAGMDQRPMGEQQTAQARVVQGRSKMEQRAAIRIDETGTDAGAQTGLDGKMVDATHSSKQIPVAASNSHDIAHDIATDETHDPGPRSP